jgi:hypothetical protein
MTTFVRRVAGLAFLCATSTPGAQGVRVTTLGKPDAAYREPFTDITGVRELQGGRVIAVDRVEKTLQLIDFGSGTATPVSRVGNGPTEYGIPVRLFALPGDTTLVADALNFRYLVLAPDGKAVRTFGLEDGRGDRFPGTGFADTRGHYSFTDERYEPRTSAGGPGGQKDAIVTRRDRSGEHVDTLAVLAVPAGRETWARSLPGGRIYNHTSRPLALEDAVAFAPDGRVAVVRAADYHVEWIGTDGRTVKGPPVRYEAILVTEGEKEAFIVSRTRAGQIITMVQGGGGAGTAASPPAGGGSAPRGGAMPAPRGMFNPNDLTWPATMPPFLADGARVAVDGRLWVLRARASTDPLPTYDIFDGRGQLVERVALPKGTRLVGFGPGSVYLGRKDDDDLWYLERYRITGASR